MAQVAPGGPGQLAQGPETPRWSVRYTWVFPVAPCPAAGSKIRMEKPFKAACWERSFGMRTDLRFDEKRTKPTSQDVKCIHAIVPIVSKNRIVEENYEQLRKIHLKKNTAHSFVHGPRQCASSSRPTSFPPPARRARSSWTAGKMPGFNKVLGLMLNDGGRFAACCPTKVMRVTVSRTERHCFRCTT